MRLDWVGAPRLYEDGISQAVLYSDGIGVAWNGLVAVDEGASGSQQEHYFDGRKLVITQEIGDFDASIQAFTYPDELSEPNGYSEGHLRRRFGLSYRTQASDGDKIHVVYNASINAPDRSWASMQKTIGPSVFRWDIQARAINVPGARPASHLIIDTALAAPQLVDLVEGWLYGTVDTDARLPEAEEFIDIFEAATTLRIWNNGDGTWTASGPDDVVVLEADNSFHISAPTALYLDESTFVVDSF